MSDGAPLPCPPLDLTLEIPPDAEAMIDASPLPARPGVACFENEARETIGILATADLRRLARTRLAQLQPGAAASPRTNYRMAARRLRAVVVGSAFEADWAYLQLARRRMPASYRMLTDRWQAWFITCDAEAPHPQFQKTVHPPPPSPLAPPPLALRGETRGVEAFGPFRDKHAAGRFIDLLIDALDLCRYQHILVQAPHGRACAYKEMGRCSAPCDGSATMESYHALITEAMALAAGPDAHWRGGIERAMSGAAAAMNFEEAAQLRALLERSDAASRPEFALRRPLRDFRWLGVMPAGRRGWVRLFCIAGGWIAPIADVKAADVTAEMRDSETNFGALLDVLRGAPADFSPAGLENIGLVCWHLFQRQSRTPRGAIVRVDELEDVAAMIRIIKAIAMASERPRPVGDPAKKPLDSIEEMRDQELEAE